MTNKPLSNGRSIRSGWRRFRRVFFFIWRSNKFSFFPCVENLLISFWYDFQYYKAMRRGATVYDFLDQRVSEMKRGPADTQLSVKKKRLRADLLAALHDPRLRQMIVTFLEAPEAEAGYLAVVEAMKSAWRTAPGEETALPKEAIVIQEAVVVKEAAPPSGEGHVLIGSRDEVQPPPPSGEGLVLIGSGDEVQPVLLYAKTYVVAAEIDFELQGKRAEFCRLVKNVVELKKFVQEKFGVTKLAGTFKKLKGFTYQAVLDTKNDSKIGQLKVNIRQIIENPMLFGEKVVERAKQIAEDHFI